MALPLIIGAGVAKAVAVGAKVAKGVAVGAKVVGGGVKAVTAGAKGLAVGAKGVATAVKSTTVGGAVMAHPMLTATGVYTAVRSPAIMGHVSDGKSLVEAATTTVVGDALSVGGVVANAAGDVVKTAGGVVANAAGDALKGAGSAVVDAAGDAVKEFGSKVKNFLMPPGGLVEKIVNGVVGAFNWVRNTVSGLFNKNKTTNITTTTTSQGSDYLSSLGAESSAGQMGSGEIENIRRLDTFDD